MFTTTITLLSVAVVVLLCSCPTRITCATQYNIAQAPENLVIRMNATGNFTCRGNGPSTSWRINGTDFQLGPISLPNSAKRDWIQRVITDPNVTHVLQVTARIQYNNTIVTCVTGNYSSFTESEEVTLRIEDEQGNRTNTHDVNNIDDADNMDDSSSSSKPSRYLLTAPLFAVITSSFL